MQQKESNMSVRCGQKIPSLGTTVLHHSAKPCGAKHWPSGHNFLSAAHTHVRFLYFYWAECYMTSLHITFCDRVHKDKDLIVNSTDPDQTLLQSDLGLHCLPKQLFDNLTLITVVSGEPICALHSKLTEVSVIVSFFRVFSSSLRPGINFFSLLFSYKHKIVDLTWVLMY